MFRRCHLTILIWLAPVVVTVICGASVACLTWSRIWVPSTPTILTVILIVLGQGIHRMRHLHSALQCLTVEQAARTRRRRWPTNPVSAADPWPLLLDFVSQLVPFQRIAALEANSGTLHMCEAGFRGCDREAVIERRRDYSREPYESATRSRRPRELKDDERYFAAKAARRQFLVPFCHAGETLGFVAIELASDHIESTDALLRSLETISHLISEILYRRGCRLLDADLRASDFQDDILADTHQLNTDTLDLECRLTRLEHMFQRGDVASIIYDLYGQLLMINDRMSDVLKRENLAAANCNAPELIQRLSACDEVTAKRIFAEIALGRATRTLPARLRQAGGKYALIGSPLESELHDDSLNGIRSPNSLDIWGIRFELVDQSFFDTIDWLDGELAACLAR
jgi:hypothetical protein